MDKKILETSKGNYIIKVNAEGYHFSRKAFTYDEWVKIREFALKLKKDREKDDTSQTNKMFP